MLRTGRTLADPRFGGFQKYALASSSSTAKLNPSVSFHAASSTISNLASVVSALSIYVGLDQPPISGIAKPKNKKILIYGGSSSCGGFAIQYAATAGYTVVTTSSQRNIAFVKSLGPVDVIDHNLPAHEVVSALMVHGPYDHIFDTVGLPPVTSIMVDYLLSQGGGMYHTLIPAVPGTRTIPRHIKRVHAPYAFALVDEAHETLARWLFEDYLPQGLVTGSIVPTRQEVVTGGLEKVQDALDQLLKDRKSVV